MPGNLAGWLVGRALGLERAGRTIAFAGVVADEAVLADPGSGFGHLAPILLQPIAAGTGIFVCFTVEDESGVWE